MNTKIGRVYKVISSQSNECYVGATFNTTRDRFRVHKAAYNQWKKNSSRSCTVYELFEKYGLSNCKMVLIKEYPVVDRLHLNSYEQLWINKLNSINHNNPFGWGIKYLDQIKNREYMRNYISERGEEYKLLTKQYYDNNKEAINNKKKEYYEANKELLKEKRRKYYEANKAAISARRRLKYQADKENKQKDQP